MTNVTYDLMEDAMLGGQNMLDNDVLVAVVKKALVEFIKRMKFTQTILVPTLDSPFGVAEVKADDIMSQIDGETFNVCVEVLPPGAFISGKAWTELSDWLESGAVRKSFMINKYECHILKADMYNETFISLTLELIEDTEE